MPPIGVENITDIAEFDGRVYARGEKNRFARFFELSTDEDRLTFIPEIPPFEKVTTDQQARLNRSLDPFRDALTEEAKQNFKVDEPLNLEDYDPDKLSAALENSFHDFDTIVAISRSGNYAVSNTTFYVEHGQKLLRWKPGAPAWSDTGLTEAEKLTPPDESNKHLIRTVFKFPLVSHLLFPGVPFTSAHGMARSFNRLMKEILGAMSQQISRFLFHDSKSSLLRDQQFT